MTHQTFVSNLMLKFIFLLIWVLWYINLCTLFDAKSIFIQKIVLFQIIQFNRNIVFVCIQLNGKTVLFQTIKLSISTQFKCQNSSILNNSVYHKYTVKFYLTYRCYNSGPERTWQWWQWRGTLHSPKLQHYWSLTIILFSIIFRTFAGGV